MKILLVDGYNVIRSTPPYQDVAEDDLESAREILVNDVAAFAQGEWDATIVFDGGNNPRSDGSPHRISGITVRFSPYGQTADSIVEALARSARERGVRVDVVTSDAQTQWAVLGDHVARRSAKEFSHELRLDEADWRERTPSGSATSRIEERISPDVRAVLERWARGES